MGVCWTVRETCFFDLTEEQLLCFIRNRQGERTV